MNTDATPHKVTPLGSYVRILLVDHIQAPPHNHHHTVQVTQVQVEYLRQLMEGKKTLVQVAKGHDQHQCKLEWAALTTYNNHHHHPKQIRTSMGALGVTNAAINANCIRLNGVPFHKLH